MLGYPMKEDWSFFFMGWVMKRRIAGLWRQVLPKIKIGGVWKDVNTGWIKVNGVFRKFKFPLVTPPMGVIFRSALNTGVNGNVYERRSFIRSGWGPAVGGTPGPVSDGAISYLEFTVEGETWLIRGIETGSDVVGGVASWKWVSLQFFGRVDVNKLAQVIYLNGHAAISVGHYYEPQYDITFITHELVTARQFPVDVHIDLKF